MTSSKRFSWSLLLALLNFRRASTCNTGESPQQSLPLQSALSRELFSDILSDCQKTSIFQYRAENLGPIASQSTSDYFTLQVPVQTFLGNEIPAVLDPSFFAMSLLLSELEQDGRAFEFENQSFGRNGEYTEELLRHHSLLTQFWNVEEHSDYSDIVLLPLHSDTLEGNLETAITFYLNLFKELGSIRSFEEGDVPRAAEDAKSAIQDIPNSYANPDLTFNALFAVPSLVGHSDFSTSSFIMMGDGMLDYFDSLGLGEVGSDFVHAHEFAHAVVFLRLLREYKYDLQAYLEGETNGQIAVGSNSNNAVDELEADAMAAYALAHDQGLNFSVSQLTQAADIAASIGDRLDFLVTHHGTPEQRVCATRFGADEGRSNDGTILSSEEFHTLFVEMYPSIAALDPSVCSFEGANETLQTILCDHGFATDSGSISMYVVVGILIGAVAVIGCIAVVCKNRTGHG